MIYSYFLMYLRQQLFGSKGIRMNHTLFTRREFASTSLAALSTAAMAPRITVGQTSKPKDTNSARVLYPRNRIPVSFIIDDSTCLVNMGHFGLPQFAEAWPNREVYKKPWKTWPREIPDAFVREFGEWCSQNGVKGKYSIVPYPACVGWLDRELPGWSRKELQKSLELVRTLIVPDWDIHPEMITHTRVIDLKTGRPLEEISSATMENSYPREKKSVDELAAYLAYALKILKNCGFHCDGITTPGGFGNFVKPELSLAVEQSVKDVYQVEIPHYFKYVISGKESTEPNLEHVIKKGDKPVSFTVNIPAGTGDWFGSWEGDAESQPDRYITKDGRGGRMAELIARNEPALFLCHWPGMYCNGTKSGFHAFQQVVTSLNDNHGDRIIWMKLSEIARYWAAKEFTKMTATDSSIQFDAPFSCPNFTIEFESKKVPQVRLETENEKSELFKTTKDNLAANTIKLLGGNRLTACLNLPKGQSKLTLN